MHSTLHLPASEAYKMVGLRDGSRTPRRSPSAASEPQPAAARRTSHITVVRRVTGRTVA
jgi:hypothetical protein